MSILDSSSKSLGKLTPHRSLVPARSSAYDRFSFPFSRHPFSIDLASSVFTIIIEFRTRTSTSLSPHTLFVTAGLSTVVVCIESRYSRSSQLPTPITPLRPSPSSSLSPSIINSTRIAHRYRHNLLVLEILSTQWNIPYRTDRQPTPHTKHIKKNLATMSSDLCPVYAPFFGAMVSADGC